MLTRPRQAQGLPQPRSTPPPLRLATTALLLALLAACRDGAPAPGITIALSSGAVEVVRGDAQQLTITLSRQGGASTAVQLTVSGLPADASASFDPPTLSGAAGQSTLTITVDPAAAEGSSTLTVTASAGDLEDSVQLTLEIVSLEVSGRVITVLALPLAGVVVSSQGQTTVTTAQGAFTLSGLSLPYDLVLSSAAAFSDGAMHVYAGLDETEPVLMPYFGINIGPSFDLQATVEGDVLGGNPIPAGQAVRVCLEGLHGVALGCAEAMAGATSYSINGWWVAGDMPARIHALHMTVGAGNLVSGYLGYAVHDLTLSDGGNHTADLDFDAIDEAMLSVTPISESGAVIGEVAYLVRLGANLLMPLGVVPGPGPAELPVPVAEGLSYTVATMDDSSPISYAWKTDLGLDPVQLTVPVPPTLVTPADAASGVDLNTVFTIAEPVGRARTFHWATSGSGANIVLTTTQSSVTIPDPTPYGLTLAPGAVYGWFAMGTGTEGMGPATLSGGHVAYSDLRSPLTGVGGPGPILDGSFTIADERSFTTAP